jgi:outer membrane protein assembly factor BamB
MCGIASNVLYALDTNTGKKLWSVQLSVSPDCYNPVIMENGRAFYITPQGIQTAIVAREVRTGDLLWEAKATKYVSETAGGGLAIANGMVYGVMNELYALDKNTGKLIWYSKFGSKNGLSQPLSWPVVDGKTIIIGTTEGIEAFNAEKGTPLWRLKTGGMVHSRPAVHSGQVFFGCDDTYFYCLGYRDK